MPSPNKSIVLSAILSAGIALNAGAVPAKQGLLPMTQPDGSVIMVHLTGDENSHHYYTEDGYLLFAEGDRLCYARVGSDGLPVNTGTQASDIKLRSAAEKAIVNSLDKSLLRDAADRLDTQRRMHTKRTLTAPGRPIAPSISPLSSDGSIEDPRIPGLFPGTNFPSLGSPKVLVILAEFSDITFHLDEAHDYFQRMLTEQGFADYGGTGSALDYFLENSDGRFVPQFDLFGPVKLPNKCSYYGGNDWTGNDERPEEMIIDACQLLDEHIDFSQYDTDGDGVIDNVFVFYAGRGEADGGASYTIWPHSWNIYESAGKTIMLDGVLLDRYACSNEWQGTRPDGIGTFVHEFSHVLGLPDLYDTRYTGAFTPGSWSVMDYGPYNNNGCTPPYYSAWERASLGWLEPLPIDTALNATLPPITSGKAGIIHTPDKNEFFILENRQKTGWDRYIPGHGMLIWHIDFNESVWNMNSVNNTPSHQYVDIEEADNLPTEGTRASDAFPGSREIRSFTDDTSPSMKTWSKKRLGLPITDIDESDKGIITFKVLGGTDPLTPLTALPSTDSNLYGFTAHWNATENAMHMLSVFTRDEDSVCTFIPGYDHLRVGATDSFVVTGLDPNTVYYYTVTYGTAWEMAEESNEIEVITSGSGIWRQQVNMLPPREVTDSTFILVWEPVDDAVDYLLTVNTEVSGIPSTIEMGFDDGVTKLPEGWISSTKTAYAMASYSGKATPSLRMGQTADYIMTPEFTEGIRTLSFWIRGNGTSAVDSVRVTTLCDGEWTATQSFPIPRDKGGHTVVIDAIPDGSTAAKIIFDRYSGAGSLALDDIVIGYGDNTELQPIEGYERRPVGNVTEYTVTGLTGNKTYTCTIAATDGEIFSKDSEPMSVSTSDPNNSALSDIASDSYYAIVKAEGLTLTVYSIPAGTRVRIYDTIGRPITEATATNDGMVTLALPASGIYVMQIGSSTRNIAVNE